MSIALLKIKEEYEGAIELSDSECSPVGFVEVI